MSKNYELPVNPDGTKNPKYIDLLDEDKAISGQKFVCVSFVSPEKILKQKQNYFFERFLQVWDFTKSADKFRQFLNFMSHKYSLNLDVLFQDFQEYCDEERSYLSNTTIEDDYKTFLDANEEKLEQEFSKEHAFQTSVRSIKVRGSFATQDEAELRCKMLREVDPNHDVYVGPVGMWMPWEPEAYKTGRVEYLEPELNKLMQEKMKNDKQAKEDFEKRLKETKKKAITENIEKAKSTGNKLSQNIDSEGNLYDVNVGIENDISTVADVAKELFENDNVVPVNTDKGLGALQQKYGENNSDGIASGLNLDENLVLSSSATETIYDDSEPPVTSESVSGNNVDSLSDKL